MLINVDHHSAVPIYRQLLDQISQQILSGNLRPGSRLDSVRELASRLKVNPMTVSKTYSLLEGQGFVERRRGIGIFVAQMAAGRREAKAAELLEQVLANAALVGIQMGISQTKAVEILKKHYQSINKQTEG